MLVWSVACSAPLRDRCGFPCISASWVWLYMNSVLPRTRRPAASHASGFIPPHMRTQRRLSTTTANDDYCQFWKPPCLTPFNPCMYIDLTPSGASALCTSQVPRHSAGHFPRDTSHQHFHQRRQQQHHQQGTENHAACCQPPAFHIPQGSQKQQQASSTRQGTQGAAVRD